MTVLMSEGLADQIDLDEIEIPAGAKKIKDHIAFLIVTSAGMIPGLCDFVDVAAGGKVISVVSGIHHHDAGLFCRGILVIGVIWTASGEKEISWVLPERKEGYSYSVINKGDHDLPDVYITLTA